jgi:hypothetical membrane protein
MPPSKKIFIGASAIITGVLCQIIVAWLISRAVDALGAMQGGDSSTGEHIDLRLEQLHSQTQIGWNAITMSYAFILSGVGFLLIGVYQTAKRLETLLAVQSKET